MMVLHARGTSDARSVTRSLRITWRDIYAVEGAEFQQTGLSVMSGSILCI